MQERRGRERRSSLLSHLTDKERAQSRGKGIFTVSQLAYTFRPRRRSKRLAARPERYHHALKALAIREHKIHVVGKPELPWKARRCSWMSKGFRIATSIT